MFEGIPAGMQEFMVQLRERNDKPWYEAHKEEHRRLVKEPFGELALELGETVREIDPRMIVDPKRCVSRPRRDTRFTKDKTLYRSNVWIGFKPAEDRWDLPLYYFEVFPDYFRYGLAFMDTSPTFMRKLRDYMTDCPNDFRQACKEAKNGGLILAGEQYKKPKEDAPKGLEEWFTYKDFYWKTDRSDNEILQTRDFIPDVQKAFRACEHFYQILIEVSNSRPGDYRWE